MPITRKPNGTRSPSKLIPHRPPGKRGLRVHSSVTEEESVKLMKVAESWYGVDLSVLLYFKSIREILRLHDVVFPKGKAPIIAD